MNIDIDPKFSAPNYWYLIFYLAEYKNSILQALYLNLYDFAFPLSLLSPSYKINYTPLSLLIIL